MGDTKYLEKRRQGFYAVVEVPPSLRERLGKRLKKTLETRELAIARQRRWRVVADLKAQIEAARKGTQQDPILTEALGWRESLEAAERGEDVGFGLGDDPETFIRDAIIDRSEELATKDPGAASTLYGIATGTATPLLMHLETWLSEGGVQGQFTERTKGDHRRALAELEGWLVKAKLATTTDAITRKVAGRFTSEHLLKSGRAAKTIGKSVSSLSSYWAWLRKRGYVSEEGRSPWADQAPTKRASAGDGEDKVRPFADAEVATLFKAPPDPLMEDFMRMGALSGMRREEIARLTVANCAGGIFIVEKGKTKAARRRVPIHTGLSDLVARRCHGKAPGAFLFDDLSPPRMPKAGGKAPKERVERSDAIGKRFTRYRRSLGIQDGDGRQSAVTFHSFRRWFITAAVNAGQPPHMVSLLVGHEEGRKGMTLGRYWGGADDEGLRAVVEAVKLPG